MKVMKKKTHIILLFVLPCLLLFGVFGLGPILPPLVYSFYDYKFLQLGDFIGFENFVNVFKDPAFGTVLLNNMKLLFWQFLIGAPLSFACAVMISAQGPRVRRFFKTASFLPYILSVAVVCTAWSMMLQPRWGAIQNVMELIGIGHLYKPWLATPEGAFGVASFTVIWQAIGYNMLLYYAGMKSIPESYFEAARLDGANMWQQVFYITLPLLKETLKFTSILMITGTLGMVANIKILTSSAMLGEKSYSSIMYIYNTAFGKLDFGYGYALTIVYALICFVIVLFVNKLLGKERVEYD